MFGALTEAVVRVAKALETGSNRAPTEDQAARERLAALEARLLPLEASEATLRAAVARHAETFANVRTTFDGLTRTLDSLRERHDVKRLVELEAQVVALDGALKKLRGKVYGDREFHTPAPKADAVPVGGDLSAFLASQGVQ